MDAKKLCPSCFNEIGNGETVCPCCGYDLTTKNEDVHVLQPGTILQGKYYVGNVLGEGGFGITYIGYDLNLEVKLAIKEFYPNGYVTRESTVSPTITKFKGSSYEQIQKWQDNFIKEARKLAKLTNLPGIVSVRDFFCENDTAYIVMEYVEGTTLKKYLSDVGGRLSISQTLEMIKPVIQSLDKVHKCGIIHRDISPDNIMIQDGAGMKLIDFGAARAYSADEKSLSIMLKPGYALEEQYRTHGNQGPWTDVYAISATIYRCITGIKPEESMERMRKDTVKRPSEYGVNISPSLEAVLMKGMAVYAEDRYHTMQELLCAIDNAIDGTTETVSSINSGANSVSGNRPSMTVANKSSGDKKKVYIGICVAVLVIIVIAIKSCTNKSDDVKIESETRQESTVCESMPDEEATVYDATENSEENVVTEDDEYGFASAEIGDVVTFGTYEGEPVEWDVLDKEDGKALLISHHVLRNHTYDQEDEWEGEDTNWEQSEMRAWLNNEFINELFNDQQKSKIQETTLSNPSSASFYSTYYPNASFEENTNPCGDTVDKLFLLSWEEIIKYYGPLSMEDPNGWGYTCAYADSLACTDRDGVVNWYYLRSPGNNGVNALRVDFGGEVNVNIHVNYEGGVRPALYVTY